MKRLSYVKAAWRHYRKDEEGAMTFFSLLMFFGMLMIGGLAVDATNVMRAHTQLQTAADAAGHAALYWAERNTTTQAKLKAVEVANRNMPTEIFGTTLQQADIEFGSWDSTTNTFTPDPNDTSAVRVNTRRIAANQNGVRTFLLKLVGVGEIDINTDSIWETYRRGCLREGFVAQGRVDLQSNNSYTDGFCVHSNTQVELNSNNYFEDGTIVSIPSPDDLTLPRSGYDSNEGLYEALEFGPHLLRVFEALQSSDGTLGPTMLALMNPLSTEQPSYIDPTKTDATGSIIHNISINGGNPKLTAAYLEPNMVNRFTCNNTGGKLTIEEDLDNVVLITNCSVTFANGVGMQNARLITTSTDTKSVQAPNGMRIGLDDSCTSGGDAQIVTLGGFEVASGLEAYGAQILAMKNIEFSANADGIEGASFTSNQEIHGTSNMSFGFCGTGVPNNIEVDYFRMVM